MRGFAELISALPGTMAQRIAAYNWAATSLGALEAWPQPLKTIVMLVLESKFPTILYWGPELIGIYNDAYVPLLGTKSGALGRSVREIWYEAWDAIAQSVERALRGEFSYFRNAQFTLLRKGSPESAWFDYEYSPLRDEQGAVAGFLNIAIEKTDQVIAEKELRESEERFRRIFDSNMIAIAFWRSDGSLTEVNQAFCNLIGCTPEEVTRGQVKWSDFTPPEILWRDQQGIDEINATGTCQPYEKVFIHRKGRRVPILVGGASIGGIRDQGVAFAVDLTQQKEIEHALRESEERFRIMADGVPMIIWVTNKEGGIQFVTLLYVFCIIIPLCKGFNNINIFF